MRELREQLMDGYDFAKMAEEHRGNEQQQIDLGWFKRGEFMEEFETIAFSMREGEISPVFTTQLGFHICKLTGRRPPAPVPLEDIKDVVRSRMVEEYRDKKFNGFVDELKGTASIEDSEPCGEGCGCH
jgi:peptidyl-prolyl cis-trans isomerase C